MLTGTVAWMYHTLQERDTKDLDICVLPEHRGRMIEVFNAAGLDDYAAQNPYDREWIYRGEKDGVIVDCIWQMANHHAPVDHMFFRRAPETLFHGELTMVIPAEELIWWKAFVLQRDRCDWPDVLSLMAVTAPTLDWAHLVSRFDADVPLLFGLLNVLSWLSPESMHSVPAWLRSRIPTVFGDPPDGGRAPLLDSRPWFATDNRSCLLAR